MILITALLLFFGLFGDSTPEHIKLSQKVSSSYAKEIQEKRNLQYIGGGGALKNNVEIVKLTFLSEKCTNLYEARKIVIEMNEELIEKYNNYSPIRPYLSNFPFEPKNIAVTINFPIIKCCQSEDLVTSVTPIGDIIFYQMYSPKTGKRTENIRENYLDAYKIVYGHYKIVYGHDRPK